MLPNAQPKPLSRAEQKRDTARQQLNDWLSLRRFVLERDHYRCRACGSPQDIDMHHIRLRSVGGLHTTGNCAVLCRICHRRVHAYRLFVEGDANGKLRFEKMT